jgi:hypothetical protein
MNGEHYSRLRNIVGGVVHGGPHVLPARFAGKRQLLEALLLDAVRTFQATLHARKPRERQRFAEAEAWLLSDDTEYIFSFVKVCTLLGLRAGAVRAPLGAWKAFQLLGGTEASAASKSRFRIIQR